MKNVPDEQQVSVDPKREQIGTILRELLRCSGAATQTAAAMIGYDFAMESAYKIAVENEDLRQYRDERIDSVVPSPTQRGVDMAWWAGFVVCNICGHEHVAVIEIPAGECVPLVRMECSRCGSMTCDPKEERAW